MEQNFKIAIIGLGYVGLPLAISFSKYYETIGYDIDNNKVSLSYSLKFQSKDKTLEDKEIDSLISNILLFLAKEYNAVQR